LRRLRFTVQWMLLAVFAVASHAQTRGETFQPVPGQPGKDVVWVPTPYSLLEKMLDMAAVTPKDYVIDLGSGDGRNVIAAAKRGARALGVEFNPDMVELSRRNAIKEGVADRARFVEGDMFAADISKATVLALFLLPDNLRRLTPKFVDLRPGTRIVLNGFPIPEWSPDETQTVQGDCGNWCTSHLYYVPAKVAGTWRMPQGVLTLEQNFQKVTGTLAQGNNKTPISDVRLKGDQFSFTALGSHYEGRVNGEVISGEVKGATNGRWTATRVRL
jgi:SAM-dependent methyltransferase